MRFRAFYFFGLASSIVRVKFLAFKHGFGMGAAEVTVLFLSGCHPDIPKGARVLHYDYAGGRNVRTLALDGGVALPTPAKPELRG